ncbi:MAG TPA: hypothetical protein VGO32_04515, partial [Candidatus Limnocylindria bacterium]|nr:hypothetical protein [Candidatus Limnocylindria bacterium]
MSSPEEPASDGRFVRVAVDAQVDRPERTFTYRWPADLPDEFSGEAGSLVLVPYGGRLALGYLLGDAREPLPDALPIETVVSRPLLTQDLIDLAEAIAIRYRAPMGTTLAAMLPPGMESRLERRWEILEPLGDVPVGSVLTESQLSRLAPRAGPRWIESRRRAGALRAAWRLRPPTAGPRHERTIRLLSRPDGKVTGAVQRVILDALGPDEIALADLATELGRSPSSLLAPARRLEAAGSVELGWHAVRRDPLAHRTPGRTAADSMAPEQAAALAEIGELAPAGELLLEGVAASGKSDVILAAVTATVA